jgi:hypothetical protein
VSGSPDYFVEVDWFSNNNYTDPNDDVSTSLTQKTSVTSAYGRDDARALTPIASGKMAFELCDPNATFSPDSLTSPIASSVKPGRPARLRVRQFGVDHILFAGHIDALDFRPTKYSQSVPITVLDGIAKFKGTSISTALVDGIQTGAAIGLILDQLGWPALKRDIDVGATTLKWWWENAADAFDALTRVINCEGPPAIAYVDPNTGNFVFKDRNHRLFRAKSLTSQATFCTGTTSACGVTGGPCPTGSFDYTDPFEYSSGWKNIVNQVRFSVPIRKRVQYQQQVWKADNVITVHSGETVVVKMVFTDPVIPPSLVTMDDSWGGGTLSSIVVDRDTGQTITLFLGPAVGGDVNLIGLAYWAFPVTVSRTVEILREDATSITDNGVRAWPNTNAPFLNVNDADAIGQQILTRYKDKTATVRLRVVACDGAYLAKILALELGDRITIHNRQFRLADDFTIERIEHTVLGRGKIHAVVFACERVRAQLTTAFTFDVAGLGFDDGVFGLSGYPDPSTLFRFDVAGQGFDQGKFGY